MFNANCRPLVFRYFQYEGTRAKARDRDGLSRRGAVLTPSREDSSASGASTAIARYNVVTRSLTGPAQGGFRQRSVPQKDFGQRSPAATDLI